MLEQPASANSQAAVQARVVALIARRRRGAKHAPLSEAARLHAPMREATRDAKN